MEKDILLKEKKYLSDTIELLQTRLDTLKKNANNVEEDFLQSNSAYFDYLKDNANKMNEDDFIEIEKMQGNLTDIEKYDEDLQKNIQAYSKMISKPYFASINLDVIDEKKNENYYIGIHSLMDDEKSFRVIDWRSPIASIFYDYEKGACKIRTKTSILKCDLKNKRQFGITDGVLDYYIDSDINIEDSILQETLAKNATNQMKSIIETIQKEQNEIIRGDENSNLIVQGVAGSGKTAIALHRIAYLLYKMKDKIKSNNIHFVSPNNAFSSYISSVLPDLAEDDIEKVQLDILSRNYLKKHLILEKKYEQMERLIKSQDLQEYNYKTSIKFLNELLAYAKTNYIDNFDIEDFQLDNTIISAKKIKEFFFGKYQDRDLFTRLRWITDNIYDIYFYSVKNPNKKLKYKEFIFRKLYSAVENKNCVKAYMNFLQSKGLKLQLVGDKVKNEDAYGILFFRVFIYGLDKFDSVKHLVIDEFQDYSPVQIYILNYLYDCPKTILGDFNQTIDSELAYENLNNVANILGKESKILKLSKTYRSTAEIVDFAKAIGDKDDIHAINRHGDKVDIVKCTERDETKQILNKVEEFKSKGFNSIAIITKTNNSAQELYKDIHKFDKSISLIDDNIDYYDNKTCVISAFNSKGLEFDAIIIYNVNCEDYKTELDKNILYIASTRALHKLSVTYRGNKSIYLDKYKE